MKYCRILLLMVLINLLIAPVMLLAQNQYTLRYTVNGLKVKKAYLLSMSGSTYEVVDSCAVGDGVMQFTYNDSLPAGVYRLAFSDSLFTDVILNKENVTLENAMPDLDQLKVTSSEETRVFYAYWKVSRILNDTINAIATTGNLLYEASNHQMTPTLDSMQRHANALNKRLTNYADSLVRRHPDLLASSLIKAYITPDYLRYLRSPGAYPYKTLYDFLRDHFFDNIKISDDRLLNSEVIYVTVTDYLTTFGDPPSTENYNRAIDTIMQRFSANPSMQEYVLKLLLNTFQSSNWEKVFIHLTDVYVYPNSCDVEGGEDYIATAEVLKNLALGKPAPPIKMPDLKGNMTSLYDVEAKLTLLLFWSSECSHCHEVMPALIALYDAWHEKGFQVVAVSIDTDVTAWKAAAVKTDARWIHLCDLKGFESETLKVYHTWKTPGFFLLGPEKNILSKPLLVSQIKDVLEQYLK